MELEKQNKEMKEQNFCDRCGGGLGPGIGGDRQTVAFEGLPR